MPGYSKPRARILLPASQTSRTRDGRWCGKIVGARFSLVTGLGSGAADVALSLRGTFGNCFRRVGGLGAIQDLDDGFFRFIGLAFLPGGGVGATQVALDLTEQALPVGEPLGTGDFMLHRREGVEKQLADVGENGGVAGRDAIAGQHGKEPAEGVIDRGGGLEIFDRAKEFSGDGFGVGVGLELLPAMLRAEGRMVVGAQHAAAVAAGGSVLAAII